MLLHFYFYIFFVSPCIRHLIDHSLQLQSELTYIPSESENATNRLEKIWNLQICHQMTFQLLYLLSQRHIRINADKSPLCEKIYLNWPKRLWIYTTPEPDEIFQAVFSQVMIIVCFVDSEKIRAQLFPITRHWV